MVLDCALFVSFIFACARRVLSTVCSFMRRCNAVSAKPFCVHVNYDFLVPEIAASYSNWNFNRRRCSSSSGDCDRISNHECNNLRIINGTKSSEERQCSPEARISFHFAKDSVTTESGNENLPFEPGTCVTIVETCVVRRQQALSAELCIEEAVKYSSNEVVKLKRKLSVEYTSVGSTAANVDECSTAASSADRGLPPRPFRRRKMISLISNIVKSQQSDRLDERTALSLVKLLNDHEHNVILQCLTALKTVSTSTENQVDVELVMQLFQSFYETKLQVLLDSFNVTSRIRELLEAHGLSQNALIILIDCISTLSSSPILRAKLASCIPQLIQLLDYHIRSRRFRDACLQALLKLVDDDLPDGSFKHSELLICNLLHVFKPDSNSRAAELAVTLLAKLASSPHAASLILNCKASHPDLTRFLESKNGPLVLNFLILLDRLVQTIKNPPNGGINVLHANVLYGAHEKPGVTYEIKCTCSASYIYETGDASSHSSQILQAMQIQRCMKPILGAMKMTYAYTLEVILVFYPSADIMRRINAFLALTAADADGRDDWGFVRLGQVI
ncbi:hypothetical protein TTRE_0000186201 [Trichuris trichiura]|uniref:Uncharacterized protein n=1 Tax=Trichuris trichiura TaxID=36087 RepID=A0A077YZQ5_TRITR|nr:hypothetical protein TTRE_0000186201 [Trichuris trichiura]